MLIHMPAQVVYEAFIDPNITTRFWFTRSTGKLEPGKQVRWDWEMYGVSTLVEVNSIEPARHISIVWGLGENPTIVEWSFSPRPTDATFVTITNSGFSGDGDRVVEQAMDSAAGFSLVLAGLKAYLEHGIELNLGTDRYPDKLIAHPGSNPPQ